MKKIKMFGVAMLMLFQLMLPQTILAKADAFSENFEGNVDSWTTNSATAHGDVAFVNGQYAKSLDDTSLRMYSSNGGEKDLSFSTGFNLGSKQSTDKYAHFSMEYLQENACSGMVIMLNNSATRQYLPAIQISKSWPESMNFGNFGLNAKQKLGVWNKVDLYFEYGTNNLTVFLNGEKKTGTVGDLAVDNVTAPFVAQDFSSISINHETISVGGEFVPSAIQFDNILYERTSSIPETQEYRCIGEVIDFDDGVTADNIKSGQYKISVYTGDALGRFDTSGNPAFGFSAPSNVRFNSGVGGYPSWNQSANFSQSVSWPSNILEDIQYNTGATAMGENEYGHLTFMAMKNGNSTNPDIKVYIKKNTMKFSQDETIAQDVTLFEVNDTSVKFFDETADISFASDKWYKIDIVFKNGSASTVADCYIDGVEKLSDFEIKSDSVLNYIGDIHFTSGASPGFLSSATKNYTIDDLAFGVFDEHTICNISSGYSMTTNDDTLRACIDNSNRKLILNELYTVEALKENANEQITVYDIDGNIVEKGQLDNCNVKVSNGFGGGVWYSVETIENVVTIMADGVPCYEFSDGVISAEMAISNTIPSGSALILAYYDAGGALKKVASSSEVVDGIITCSLGNVSNTRTGEYIKAYVWNGFDEMKPVTTAVTVYAAQNAVDESKFIYNLHDAEVDAVLNEFNAVDLKSGFISIDGELGECSVLPVYQDGALMMAEGDALKLMELDAESSPEGVVSFNRESGECINLSTDAATVRITTTDETVTNYDIYINGEFYQNVKGASAEFDLAELDKLGRIDIFACARNNSGVVAQSEVYVFLTEIQKDYLYEEDMTGYVGGLPENTRGQYNPRGYMESVQIDEEHGTSIAFGTSSETRTQNAEIWFGLDNNKVPLRDDVTYAVFECDMYITGDFKEAYLGIPAFDSSAAVQWWFGINNSSIVNGSAIEKDRWHHVKWTIDLDSDEYTFTIDGYPVTPLNTPSLTDYSSINGVFRLTADATSLTSVMEVVYDNIEYYTNTASLSPYVTNVADYTGSSLISNASEYIEVTLSDSLGDVTVDNFNLVNSKGEQSIANVVISESDSKVIKVYPENGFLQGEEYYLIIKEGTNGAVLEDTYFRFTTDGVIPDNSATLVSLEDVARRFNKIITKTDTSTVFVGNERLELTDDNLLAVNARMIYTRPDKDMLKDLFINEHPRLYINTDKLKEVRDNYGVDTNITEWTDYIIAQADSVLNKSPEAFVNNGYYDIMRLADRVRTKVMNLSFAYLITKDEDYAAKAWEEVENACSFTTWNHNVHSLDSTTFLETMALAYDWLYGYLNDTQKAYIIERCHYHILDAVYKTYHGAISYDHEWATCDNNWNASCNRSVMQAATAFFETDSDFYSDLIMNALRCYENMLKCFYPSGAWKEGPGYGLGTVSNITQAMSILNNSFDTDFNIKHTPQLDNAMDFYIGIAGSEGTNNFNDSDTSAGYTQACNFYLAKIYNKPSLAAARLYSFEQDNLTPGIYDVLFYDTSMNDAYIDMPLDSYYKGVEMVSMRSAYEDDTATFVSMHSGNNLEAEYHAHIDSGTFVVDMLGERFVKELGAENYENPGMNDIYRQPTESLITRWSYYMNRPEGHSCFVINPDFSAGQNIDSNDKIERFESGENSAYAITSLTSAYQGYAESAKRGIMLSDNRQTVTIRDEIKLNDGSNKVWWFMQTSPNTKIELIDENTAIMTLNGKQVKVLLLTNAASFEMKEMASEYLTGVDPGGDRVGYYDVTTRGKKLAVEMTAEDDLNIEVKLVPMGVSASETMLNTPLANWSVSN